MRSRVTRWGPELRGEVPSFFQSFGPDFVPLNFFNPKTLPNPQKFSKILFKLLQNDAKSTRVSLLTLGKDPNLQQHFDFENSVEELIKEILHFSHRAYQGEDWNQGLLASLGFF